MMRAYAVAQVTVKDEMTFADYRKDVLATVTAQGGRFLVRGGAISVVEGEWPIPRLVRIEFQSRAAAENWYRSPEYQKLLPLRQSSSVTNLIIVDGAE